MPGVAAIHHPLRHVDASPSDVGPPAHVGHLTYRPAVNAHSHAKFRVLPECFGDLERTARRLFGAVMKDQRHAVAGWQPDELFISRVAHLRRPEHDFRQIGEALLLLFDQELGVTDDIDEEDMPDLELRIGGYLGRHGSFYPEPGLANLFRRKGGDDFFEARIAAERVPEREQF